MGRRRVPDAEYLARYEREVRRYVTSFDSRRCLPSYGEGNLNRGRWAWLDDGSRATQRWGRYASGYRRLLVMRPDGTWRPWDWRSVG